MEVQGKGRKGENRDKGYRVMGGEQSLCTARKQVLKRERSSMRGRGKNQVVDLEN